MGVEREEAGMGVRVVWGEGRGCVAACQHAAVSRPAIHDGLVAAENQMALGKMIIAKPRSCIKGCRCK